ncbi:Hypothetical protein FKW44_009553 [Caligus rogercresseyi]|uniref:Uncharacterized protein n=1 Tax=Caligus rogercresseyi TaxID=217165 RepID=A0A7T8HFR3_CALRO|nr:Hypothetical protein FKW44_009553 [Caligus rogercresseyi]
MSSSNGTGDRSVQSSTVCSSTTPSIIDSSGYGQQGSSGNPIWDIAAQGGSSETPYELAASSAAGM